MRLILYVIASVLVVLIGAEVYWYFHQPEQVDPSKTIITYDGTNFTPASITVPLGTTVTFKNKSTEAFWPASNLHPSHSIYSEFDPKKPIASGDSWSFTFTKPGEWEYHDHIRSTHQGIVSVLNADGTVVPPVDCSLQENNQKCWEKEILASLKEGGVDGAFDKFTDLYDNEPGFAEVCHAIVHIIGEQSYVQFVNGDPFKLTTKMSYCGYGFFHGFMEYLLNQSGDINKARDFCSFVDQNFKDVIPYAWRACYHGIGHGAVDGGDPRAWGDPQAIMKPGFDLCDRLGQTDQEKDLCGTGVVNGLVVAIESNKFGLSITKDQVIPLCENIEKKIFKRGCYEQLNILIYWISKSDMQESFRILSTMKETEYFEEAMRSLATAFTQINMTPENQEKLVSACNQWQEPTFTSCIIGAVAGLVEFGPPQKEYEVGLEFCDAKNMTPMGRQHCYEGLMEISSTYYSAEKVQEICSMIPSITDFSTIPACSSRLPS